MKALAGWLSLIALLFLLACSPGGPSAHRSTAAAVATATPTATPDADQDIYWYGNKKYYPLYTVDASEKNVVYLRGFTIHKFLAAAIHTSVVNHVTTTTYRHEKNFCLVANYKVLTTTNNTSVEIIRHLAMRAIPVKINNLSTGKTERLLRIDLADAAANQATCGAYAAITRDVVWSIEQVWPERTVTSQNLTFYQQGSDDDPASTTLQLIPIYNLDFSTLHLRITAAQEVLSDGLACTDKNCQAIGLDCCINGVCVYNGHLRPQAQEHADYPQAALEVAANPAAFINYPHLYYVCGNAELPTPPPAPEKDPAQQGADRLAKLSSWYVCLKTVEDSFPHQNDIDGEVLENNADFSKCMDPQGDHAIDGTMAAWNNVRRLVWQMCGCTGVHRQEVETGAAYGIEGDGPENYASVDPEPYCPKISLAAVVDHNENIVDIVCRMPHNDLVGRPQQELNIQLSGRTAPMRFFTGNQGQYYKSGVYYAYEAGDSIDHLENLNNSVPPVIAEGTPFAYLDEGGTSEPDNLAFNMNSIMGQMVIGLSQAHPAQEIDVEYGQTYIISATSGYYTPCPMCRKDSWNDLFSAYPSSEVGRGTQAFGFITDRSTYQNNVFLGNYEDTLFGRACWVPPTMLPFSHVAEDEVIKQRLHRQQTQAALWANGYQRDWYGFNQGALIGSFDGVNWFAIGSGRKITALSTKLFLAINAPFADLADASIINVHLVTALGNDAVAEYDYDPNYEITSPYQNQAGTCQAYHFCETDQDCITQLGHEYVCADVSKFKTHWPQFNIYAQEIADGQIESASFGTIFKSHTYLAGTAKRCVYRGAGAVCKKDYTTLYQTRQGQRVPSDLSKLFTCAPNFYCAALGGTYFNDRIVRVTESSDHFLYGQEADVLGRPQEYINSLKRLPEEVQNAILDNAQLISSDTDFGLCRPGRKLTGNQLEQQQRIDPQKRTDYISQRGSCDSTARGLDRVRSCPVMNVDGNYLYNPDLADEATAYAAVNQNACGAEALTNTGANIFAEIEAGPLNDIIGTYIPTLAADACLARAGTACQTDLECSPNQLHREQVALYDHKAFGGSEAEARYWEEDLVCGQSDPRPNRDSAYNATYTLTQNRCCREVGKDLSIYTQYNKQDGDPDLIPDQGEENFGLEVGRFSYLNPQAENRYSRYTVVAPFGTAPETWTGEPYYAAPKLKTNSHTHLPVFPEAFQWKSINEVGQKTCCGSTFIRQFSDGTHQWPIGKRLNLNPNSFQCLNYESNFGFLDESGINEGALNLAIYRNEMNLNRFCRSPANGEVVKRSEVPGTSGKRNVWQGGCIQVPLPPAVGNEILYPIPNYSYYPEYGNQNKCVANFKRTDDGSIILNACAPYAPINAAPNLLSSPDNSSDACAGHYFCNNKYYSYLHLYLPAYVAEEQFNTGAAEIRIVFLPSDPKKRLSATEVAKAQATYENNGESGGVPVNPCDGNGDTGCKALDYTGSEVCEHLQAQISSGIMPNLFDDENGEYTPGGPYAFPTNSFCRSKDNLGRTIISILSTPIVGEENADLWDNAGLIFKFIPYGNPGFSYFIDGAWVTENLATNPSDLNSNLMGNHEGQVAGNDLYYMTKLGRLDLLGIPQIFYEPVYCNTLGKDLVPGIFSSALKERQDFNEAGFIFKRPARPDSETPWRLANLYDTTQTKTDINNALGKVVLQDQVILDQVFSGHEFTCCRGLGLYTASPDLCCSGHASRPSDTAEDEQEDKTLYCDLPEGTDLHVYFNRFVSSEGISEDLPVDYRLLESDFIPETGEPKLTSAVDNKLYQLGIKFCATKTVINGSGMGDYLAEDSPTNNAQIAPAAFLVYGSADEEHEKYYSVVDSPQDYNQDTNKGYRKFQQGYRWSHHMYCGPPKEGE